MGSIGAAFSSGALESLPLGQTWRRMIVYEELLEMIGAIVLIHTLLRVLALDEAPYATPVRIDGSADVRDIRHALPGRAAQPAADTGR